MSRLPIRLRLTLPFAVGMAIVLAAVGFFIHARVGRALLSSVDQSLRVQADEVATHIDRPAAPDRDRADAPQVAQILRANGSVAESTPRGLPPILSRAQIGVVDAGTLRWHSGSIRGLNGNWRTLAVRANVEGHVGAAVIGRSLEQRDEALDRLVKEFLIGGPAALLLAILAGYGLAVAALRPVEAMRRRAAAITASTTGQRLPVPPGGDELARLAETLNDMLTRLEAALEHERRFVDDASHELRTPLALLKTELELALRHPRSREELEQTVQSAAEDTDRLVRLAEDLLLVARFDQGQLPIRPERVSARSLLARAAERFATRAAEQGRSLAFRGGPDAYVDADPARLDQAIGNLVDNALVHGAGPIVLEAKTEDGEVGLHVLDSGLGLPEQFAARALDRFSRADGARGAGGAGLGLAIVDLIAQGHDGRVELGARDGGGSDVAIILPRSVNAGPAVHAEPRRLVRGA
jgi:two-component system, OmpR family, sensor kinase